MDAKSRRTLEMGNRALEFSRVNPDPSPGHEAAVGRELLSAWRAASSVATPRKAAPEGEELKPAA